MFSQSAKGEGLTGLGVNQENLTVQDEVITCRECLWNKLFKMIYLEKRKELRSTM